MQRSIDPHTRSAQDIADELAVEFGKSAAERDAAGGTPKRERDLLRASGLLSLVVPKELGGWGASWLDTYDVVRRIARVDGSLGHVFGFQHLLLATLQLFGSEAQWRPWFEATARDQLFWGNALNPLDRRTLVRWSETQAGQGRIDGEKSFCSGALDSDMLVVSAIDPATDKLLVAALPTSRSGIALRHDWDNMGQRQTDSGSARFEAVALARSEVLSTPGPLSTPFAALRPCIAQLSLSNVYLGIAYGALDAARVYTSEQSKPWIASRVEHPSDDPFVLKHYGELWVELEAARLLTDEAARALDRAYVRGPELTPEERAQAAVAIAVAKAKTTRVSLETTSRIFEVMGARATTARARVDRFWRNVRTHTLHDPVDYKLRDIGAYVLAGRAPTPSFYS